MDDTAKYVIHADITADGVVERSDVVGAVFGQTEGLLGDDLDLRDLQKSSKLGRIDVNIDSENGQSFGTITIASSLDKVETSILAAALETISRVGPCRATVAVAGIEDVRAAKRRTVVERAKELLSDSFDEDVMTSREILEEVRQSVRIEDIVEFEGLPAGPRVTDSDAIIVVEGRSDVLNLLRYGVKNAIAVEGTNVPDAVAELTQNRTVTAFLDGDRGGDLIRKELSQVGDLDYVALAPAGKSVENLARHEVMSALRSKRPFDESMVTDDADAENDPAPGESGTTETGPAATDGSARPAPETERDISTSTDGSASPDTPEVPSLEPTDREAVNESDTSGDSEARDEFEAGDDPQTADNSGAANDSAALAGEAAVEVDTLEAETAEVETAEARTAEAETGDARTTEGATSDRESVVAPRSEAADGSETKSRRGDSAEPATLREHVDAVVDGASGTARLLSESFETLAEVPAEDAFDAVKDADEGPYAVVLDGTLDQRVLDVAAQRGVGQVIAAELGEFVKQPADVRIRTADQF